VLKLRVVTAGTEGEAQQSADPSGQPSSDDQEPRLPRYDLELPSRYTLASRLVATT
jgi:hypothetical protein